MMIFVAIITVILLAILFFLFRDLFRDKAIGKKAKTIILAIIACFVMFIVVMAIPKGNDTPYNNTVPTVSKKTNFVAATNISTDSSFKQHTINTDTPETFTIIDCDNENNIEKRRLFGVYTKYGFLENRLSGSILMDEVPTEVATQKFGIESSSVSTIVAQSIPTQSIYKFYFERGLGYRNFFQSIYRILQILPTPLRIIFTNLFGLMSLIPDLIVEICSDSDADNNLFYMLVDNSLDEIIRFYLDDYEPRNIPAKSHIEVLFNEGIRHIRVTNSSGVVLESFKVSTSQRVHESKDSTVHYVYNVLRNNSYRVFHRTYSRK